MALEIGKGALTARNKPVSIESMEIMLSDLRNLIKAGYKAEALERLELIQGAARAIRHEMGR